MASNIGSDTPAQNVNPKRASMILSALEMSVVQLSGFFLLTGVMGVLNIGAVVQEWALLVLFVLFLVTGVLILFMLMISQTLDENASKKAMAVMSATADAYSSIVFFVILVLLVMFIESSGNSDPALRSTYSTLLFGQGVQVGSIMMGITLAFVLVMLAVSTYVALSFGDKSFAFLNSRMLFTCSLCIAGLRFKSETAFATLLIGLIASIFLQALHVFLNTLNIDLRIMNAILPVAIFLLWVMVIAIVQTEQTQWAAVVTSTLLLVASAAMDVPGKDQVIMRIFSRHDRVMPDNGSLQQHEFTPGVPVPNEGSTEFVWNALGTGAVVWRDKKGR